MQHSAVARKLWANVFCEWFDIVEDRCTKEGIKSMTVPRKVQAATIDECNNDWCTKCWGNLYLQSTIQCTWGR